MSIAFGAARIARVAPFRFASIPALSVGLVPRGASHESTATPQLSLFWGPDPGETPHLGSPFESERGRGDRTAKLAKLARKTTTASLPKTSL